ncbi:MmgE/PrpD family protein [Halorussus limi]|uniref:MmgE/PrpD family protein n=1 Tax=Halorussus limi TaxID=2938695 RepID=A0A8U0HWC1_9EURY|nr:MmgE/PrpD family protein [Halorussus limi]UPV75218.1 MmgE/PrpD family protein [Halorussus limi]
MTGSETEAQDSASGTVKVAQFARCANLSTYDEVVTETVRRRVLDTLAAITAGYRYGSGEVVRDHALDRAHDNGDVTVLDGNGRTAPPTEASLANATAANVLDIDDGHRDVKGHPAAVVVPAALAVAEETDASVAELLNAVYIGYEIAVRTGLTLHDVDGVYTGTGSWGAVGAAAAVGRLRDYDVGTMAAALGTAEYHAPRTPIMRGVEQPGMTKDGIGWGCYTGVEAAALSEREFTASGTVFDESTRFIEDLGTAHHITESYLKPYPCCRWAQPGIEAMRELVASHDITPVTVECITVKTFEEATHLQTRHPQSVEEAEYSYPYPVAVMASQGEFTESNLSPAQWDDPEVKALAESIRLTTDEEIDSRFPEECLARVIVETESQTHRSDIVKARGAVDRPLSESEFMRKIDGLLSPTLPSNTFETVNRVLNQPTSSVHDVLAPWN